MFKKKKGLGKGITSLLEDYSFEQVVEKTINVRSDKDLVVQIPIENIVANINQPRKHFDEESLVELSESIKALGIIQPLLVSKISDTKYSIIAGERRYRAAKIANIRTLPCLVKTFDDIQKLEVALIENIQRENLNALDEARAYSYLLDKSGFSQDQLAQRVGKNRATIANSLRLLKLDTSMQDAILRNEITAGHARAILSVKNPSEQILLYKQIRSENLSVRAAEEVANRFNLGLRAASKFVRRGKDDRGQRATNDYINKRFSENTRFEVRSSGTEYRGTLKIKYYSLEELEEIFSKLGNGDNLFENED